MANVYRDLKTFCEEKNFKFQVRLIVDYFFQYEVNKANYTLYTYLVIVQTLSTVISRANAPVKVAISKSYHAFSTSFSGVYFRDYGIIYF